jgi:2-polyprenyl-3-methyl-5-hydroxy-6-metoxy-1,4-benzoquinol methylase
MNALMRNHLPTIGADFSPAMLRFASRDPRFVGVRADAFNMAFQSESFTTVVCLRLIFHYEDCGDVFRELRRVTVPGGRILFDTLNRYSLRWLVAMPYNFYRGRRDTAVVFRTPKEVQQLIQAAGLQLIDWESRYILPTRMYRVVPSWLSRILEKAERLVPRPLRVVSFWVVERRADV